MDKDEKLLIAKLKKEVVVSVGCTEPVAVAIIANEAAHYTEGSITNAVLKLSGSIYKNALNVKIPVIRKSGIELAAAMGFFTKMPENKLTIFGEMDEKTLEKSEAFVKRDIIKIIPMQEWSGVKLEIEVADEKGNKILVRVEKNHDNVTLVSKNSEILFEKKEETLNPEDESFKAFSINNIIDIVEKSSADNLKFLQQGIEVNVNVAEVANDEGLRLGKNIKKLMDLNIISKDVINQAKTLVASAVDARMGGVPVPVMTSGGSGNQGLAIILSLYSLAVERKLSEERLLKALAIGHGVNILVKEYTGKLSSVCGCALGAGIGVTVASCWALGGTKEQIAGAVNNLVSNIMGIICDGAKASCSFKIATGVGEALLAALLAKENAMVDIGEVVYLESDQAKMFQNLGQLCNLGMKEMDATLCDLSQNQKCL